ncbi:MAG: class I SAM-dependent methyltransferase [Bacilli bacterium]|nr:class I SAM-dependent methyltransferase [Bacilli bacterium]MDD7315224.1 class I SAM-dependent methyltransferase [Bacilli bacterium]MDY4052051.1 class I SAM-dependent methyltransferase [Bacilli bacterium]
MSNQYFDNNPNLRSEEKEIKYYFKGEYISLMSDLGVFSKSGVDFGSSLLLKTLDIKKETKTILDVGCGYGTIGITIAKFNPNITVDMVDVNLRALELAKKNSLSNNVNNTIIFESNVYSNVTKNYDLIVTNPPIRAGKKIVHAILLEGYDHLNDGGELWCVIQKKQGAPSAIKALKEKYREVNVCATEKQYCIIQAKK